MKLLLLLFILAVNSFPQGILNFDNLNVIDPVTEKFYRAPVTLPDGKGAEGSRFTAGLFLAQTPELHLLATTTFREGIAAGYFLPVYKIPVPGIPPGAPATFRVRVWETAAGSYDNAVASGQFFHGAFTIASGSELVTVAALGDPSGIPSPIPIPGLGGIQPLTLVPEPQPFWLFTISLAAILLRPRSKHLRHASS